tara:strand:+ start:1068 stop:1748 length:681 start_codon:yes stop_codon:yes gene_type:complete
MKNIKIAASLICADPINLEKEVNELIESKVDLIHFDVMDGSFVPRYGLYPEILKAIKAKKNCPPVDVHMMSENPEDFIEIFALNGADYFSFHIEASKHPHRIIKKIQNFGMKPGIALNPNTSIDSLKWMIQDIEIVVLMTINPGIVGHKFITEMYKKISELRNFANLNGNTDLIIEIDGGVTPKNTKGLIEAGADALVCGNGTIFRPHEDSIKNKVNGLKSYIDEI